jgi:hypothetical protein
MMISAGAEILSEWAVLPVAGQEAKPNAMAQGRAVPVGSRHRWRPMVPVAKGRRTDVLMVVGA